MVEKPVVEVSGKKFIDARQVGKELEFEDWFVLKTLIGERGWEFIESLKNDIVKKVAEQILELNTFRVKAFKLEAEQDGYPDPEEVPLAIIYIVGQGFTISQTLLLEGLDMILSDEEERKERDGRG